MDYESRFYDVLSEKEALEQVVESLRAKVAELTEERDILWDAATHEDREELAQSKQLRTKVAEQQADIAFLREALDDAGREIGRFINTVREQTEAKHEVVEPVAWIEPEGKLTFCKSMLVTERTPLYTHPPKHETVEPVAVVMNKQIVSVTSMDDLRDGNLYYEPPSTKAAVAAALRKAAEVCMEDAFVDQWPGLKEAYNRILALPHDDSHLREFGLRVAREVWIPENGLLPNDRDMDYLQDIVNRVLGEAK